MTPQPSPEPVPSQGEDVHRAVCLLELLFERLLPLRAGDAPRVVGRAMCAPRARDPLGYTQSAMGVLGASTADQFQVTASRHPKTHPKPTRYRIETHAMSSQYRPILLAPKALTRCQRNANPIRQPNTGTNEQPYPIPSKYLQVRSGAPPAQFCALRFIFLDNLPLASLPACQV